MKTLIPLRWVVYLLSGIVTLNSAQADTFTVTNGNDDGPGSLRAAIDQATAGSTINFDYTGSILLMSGLVLDNDLMIVGPGSASLTITRSNDATGNFSLLDVATDTTVQISGLAIVGGATDEAGGGGLSNHGVLVLTAVEIADNSAFGSGFPIQVAADGGGCLNVAGATLTLTNCFVMENSCNGNGGGILNAGTLNLIDSTVSGNSGVNGGGVSSSSTAIITNCTITGNEVTTGGAHNLEGGFGGGLALSGGATLTSDTLSANTCVFEGGGIAGGDGVTLKNCIVAGNTSPSNPDKADLTFTIVSQGFNLIGIAPDGITFLSSDQTGTVDDPIDPMLGPLQVNDGSYPTMALVPGSPAIDQGVSAGLETDERGMPRTADQPNIPNAPGGDGTDIGAFELAVVAPTFANISTRLSVGTEDNVLIGGFIIAGTEPKRVLLRGLGPSLPLDETLANPVLQLADSSGAIIATNDDWQNSPDKQAIIDTTIPPTDDSESAIIATLDPGEYTAILAGKDGGTGIGLVEVYGLDETVDAVLANVSTRGFVQQGDNIMIGGVIILGTEPVDVLLRAIGPSLPVDSALSDPTLELHDSDGALIASNDDWKDSQEAEITATMIPPTDDLESAILATLTPGEYTAIVRGKIDSIGVALVEAYRLDQ